MNITLVNSTKPFQTEIQNKESVTSNYDDSPYEIENM